jgi:hypothetical protein
MEIYCDKICLTGAEITSVIPKGTFAAWLERGKISNLRGRRGLGLPALYDVDCIPRGVAVDHRALLYEAYPELSEMRRCCESEFQNAVLANIRPDAGAQTFFDGYKKPGGGYLGLEEREKYYHNAIILNAMRRAWEESYSAHVRSGHRMMNRGDYWRQMSEAMGSVCERYVNSLPWNPRCLQRQAERYYGTAEDGGDGYLSLLKTGKFGNRNRAKISGGERESLIITLLRLGDNLDCSRVAELYNATAREKGWPEVSAATVRKRAEKYRLETYAGKHGRRELQSNMMMQVRRRRPEGPLLFWSIDGWTTELLYRHVEERDGRLVTTYNNRLTTVFVIDACNDYIVGYAIGTHETPALITAALRNAVDHVRELFGERYRPAQIQSDHYGNGHLRPLFEMASEYYTPAAVGNAKAKPVERYNSDFNRDCQLAPNWSGHNVTSRRENQPNVEVLNKNRRHFPDRAGCYAQIEQIIERRRAGKREDYLERWSRADKGVFATLDAESWLYYFGNIRLKKGTSEAVTNRLTGAGVVATIEGEKRFYDSFDVRFRQHGGEDWILRYDPSDLTRVLAVNGDGTLRFLLEEKYVQPMALKERGEGDAEQLRRVREFNEQVEAHIIDTLAEADRVTLGIFTGEGGVRNDTLEKLLLVNSLGQHKDERSRERELPPGAGQVEIRQVRRRERKERKLFREEYAEYISEKVDMEAYGEVAEEG